MELLVVISVISLLIAILLPILVHARESSRRAACAGRLRAMATAVVSYSADNRDSVPRYPRSANAQSCDYLRLEGSGITPDGDGVFWADHLVGFGVLLRTGHFALQDRDALYCPSRVTPEEWKLPLGWEYTKPPSPVTYRSMGYFYRFPIRPGDPAPGASDFQYHTKLSRLGTGAALVSDTLYHIPHARTVGVNVGYSDGHAEWVGDQSDVMTRLDTWTRSTTTTNRDRYVVQMFNALCRKGGEPDLSPLFSAPPIP